MADTKVKLVALVPLHEDRAVEKNEEFEATADRADLIIKAGHARLAGAADEPELDQSGNVVLAEWKKKMSPAEYIEKYPNGPAVDLAKAHVARAEAASTDETPVPQE